MSNAIYRKVNDGSCNSSTYHKKDGTPVRQHLKRAAIDEIEQNTKPDKKQRKSKL